MGGYDQRGRAIRAVLQLGQEVHCTQWEPGYRRLTTGTTSWPENGWWSDLRNDSLLIRVARCEELDEVSLLLRDAYQQYGSRVPSSVWQSYLEDIMDVRSRLNESDLIVAESDGRLVGAVTLYLKAWRSSQEGWPQGWAGIRLLAVRPAYRGRGIGRALMEECIRRCRQQGAATVGLHTTQMMDIARGMYERMGFVRAPEFDFHPAPGAVVMAYRLEL